MRLRIGYLPQEGSRGILRKMPTASKFTEMETSLKDVNRHEVDARLISSAQMAALPPAATRAWRLGRHGTEGLGSETLKSAPGSEAPG